MKRLIMCEGPNELEIKSLNTIELIQTNLFRQ